jgi:hypothetical protein
MTPTRSPRRRSSVEQVSGGLGIKSTAAGTRHESGGGKAASEGPTAARRKGRSKAVDHGRRGAIWLPGGKERSVTALDLGASSAAAAAAHTRGCARRQEDAHGDGESGDTVGEACVVGVASRFIRSGHQQTVRS